MKNITKKELTTRLGYILFGVFIIIVLISSAFYMGYILFYPKNNEVIMIYDEDLLCGHYIQGLEKCYADMTEVIDYQNYLVEELSDCNERFMSCEIKNN